VQHDSSGNETQPARMSADRAAREFVSPQLGESDRRWWNNEPVEILRLF
jgi:hypothetical protein